VQLRSTSQSAMQSIESAAVNQLPSHFCRKQEGKQTPEYFQESYGVLYRGVCNQSRLFSVWYFFSSQDIL